MAQPMATFATPNVRVLIWLVMESALVCMTSQVDAHSQRALEFVSISATVTQTATELRNVAATDVATSAKTL